MPTPGLRARIELLVAALVGGVVGGLVVWKLSPAPTEVKPAPEVTTIAPGTAHTREAGGPEARDGEAGDDRVERLEGHVRRLQQQLAKQTEVTGYEDSGGAEPEEGKPRKITLNAADPKFEQAVRSVMEKASLEREEDERDKRESRVAKQVDRLTEKLDLNTEQAEDVEAVLVEQFEAMRALRDSDDRPSSPKEWRERMTSMRAETRKKLGEILTADQLTAYDELLEEEGWNRWGNN